MPDETPDPEPRTVANGDTRIGVPADAETRAAPRAGGPLVLGQSLGTRYRILALLGRGGMGAVYKAWDEELGLAVALKTIALPPGSDDETATLLARRFKREALLARQITHKNVVRVHDVGEVEGTKYLTMAFVEGETLSELLRRRGRLDPPEVLPLARQIAEGLGAAHAAGVVHRDLKPANIMITPAGEALIMDFGIARSANTTVTQSGMVVGTLEYMAPEQLHGDTADERTDVYALGLICYDLLLGRHRLDGVDQPMVEALSRAQRPLPSLIASRSDLPVPLTVIIDQAVRPRPEERFASAAALLDALGRLAADGRTRRDFAVGPDTDSTRPEPAPFTRWLQAAAGAALIAAAALAGWTWSGRNPPAAAPAPVSVVVAEFANQTGESIFDGLIDQAIAVGLEGASFINVYPRREALRQAQQIKADRLDVETARLIGIREGVPLVVSGDIDRTEAGAYRMTVLVDQAAPNGTRVFESETQAPSRDRILEEAGRLAVQVRRALGDRTADVASINPTETFTAGSLEAAAEYVRGQAQLAAGNRQAAFDAYERAVSIDPGLGRAWAGMGTVAYNQRRTQDAERYLREALTRVERMTEREAFRTRITYYDVMGNADEARDQGEALVARFPSDAAGLANLALAHFKAWHFTRALEVGRQAARLYPSNVLRQSNVALYALYATDFDTAAREVAIVLSLNADYPYAHLASAMIAAAEGRWDEAAEGYARLATLPAPGPGLATHGRADLSRLRGRLADAERWLSEAVDRVDPSGHARVLTSLASVRASRLDRRGAAEALARLPEDAADPGALMEAAETHLALGQRQKAAEFAGRIERRLGIQADTFAAVLRAQVALADGRARDAQVSLVEARRKADAWLVRYWLGRSYLALGAFAEADSEFDACLRRRGEALAVFLDDYPTYHRVADVHYYRGVARAGLNSPTAAESFRTFLALKDGGDEIGDLVADARKRLGS